MAQHKRHGPAQEVGRLLEEVWIFQESGVEVSSLANMEERPYGVVQASEPMIAESTIAHY
jgi:hypothetical protein